MKKVLFTLLFLGLVSCSDKMCIEHVRDYSEQIKLVKINFPEIYNLYKDWEIVIDDVYEYVSRKDSTNRVNIKYHYRANNIFVVK